MHGFVKLDADGRILVIEQEEHPVIVLLPHADFYVFWHLEQWLYGAHLPQPRDQIMIKMLVALRADVDRLAEPKVIHRDRRLARIEILGEGCQYLAAPGFDYVAPQSGRVQMAGGKSAFEGQVIFLLRRQGIEFQHFQTEQFRQITGQAGIRGNVVLIDQSSVEGSDQNAPILDVELKIVRFRAGEQMQ